MNGPVTPGPVWLRPARPRDSPFLAWGLDEAAGGAFRTIFGARHREILSRVMGQPAHTYSFEHATVAEVGGEVHGFCQGWPTGTPHGDGALRRAAGIRSIRATAVVLLGWPLVAALARHAPDEWYLQAIAVNPDARGHGVGTALFADAVARARVAGCVTLALDVDTANVQACTLYERLGLVVVSTSARAVLLGGIRVHRMRVRLTDLA